METADSYDDAVHQLDSGPIVSPVYYIVGGLNDDQGVVVTRDRLFTRDLWLLDTKNNDQWYDRARLGWLKSLCGDGEEDDGLLIQALLVCETACTLRRWLFETNYDHWGPVPKNDDRRDPGINAILALGKENVDTDSVFQVSIGLRLISVLCLCLRSIRPSSKMTCLVLSPWTRS